MQFRIELIAFLSAVSFTSLVSAQTVAYGQELQNADQTNHWVTWQDGDHACPGQVVLSPITTSLCGQSTHLGEVEYTFAGCETGTSGEPTLILDSAGNQVGACGGDSDKIHCSGDDHDIIKHGKCTVVTSEG